MVGQSGSQESAAESPWTDSSRIATALAGRERRPRGPHSPRRPGRAGFDSPTAPVLFLTSL